MNNFIRTRFAPAPTGEFMQLQYSYHKSDDWTSICCGFQPNQVLSAYCLYMLCIRPITHVALEDIYPIGIKRFL